MMRSTSAEDTKAGMDKMDRDRFPVDEWRLVEKRFSLDDVGVTETMFALGNAQGPLQITLGFLAVLLGAANAAGGYVVTDRMLGMFASKKKQVAAKSEGEN